jgi:hypothetical protein
MVDALHEMIQQTGPKEYCVQCFKKGDKLDCVNYRGICLLNVAYNAFATILHERLLPYADAVVQHYQAGFQSGKSKTHQLFALCQIL